MSESMIPAEVSLCTVTFGPPVSFAGRGGKVTVTLKSTHTVIHQASGVQLRSGDDLLETTIDGDNLTFQVPHVDQPGFLDSSGAAVTNWAYTITGEVKFGKIKIPVNRSFQVFVGQNSVDLDLIPTGPVTPGVTAPSASLLSVAGLTGHVSGSDVVGAIEPELSASIGQQAQTEGTPLRTSIQEFVTVNDLGTSEGQMATIDAVPTTTFRQQQDARLVAGYAQRALLPTDAAYGGTPTRYTTLIAGMEGETAVGSGATVTATTSTSETGGRAWRVVSNAGATEARLRVTPADAPLTFTHAAAVCARVYVPDATKITALVLDIYGDAALTFADRWTRINTTVKPLVNGWNTLRFPASVSTRVAGKWGNVYRADIIGVSAGQVAGNEFIVDRMWVESPEKATLSFVEDHCSVDFLNYGYPGLKELGVPVYWAMNPAKLGLAVVDQGFDMTRMDAAQIESVAWENRNLIGAHAWGDITTANMTPEQIRADVMRTTKWLQGRGYLGWLFRPAWWEEMATNYTAAIPLYLGMSTYKADSGLTCWPPPDIYNMPRYHLYKSRQYAEIDTLFAQLEECRGHVNLFTHRVSPVATTGLYDTDVNKWAYVLDKIAEGIDGGWLDPVNWLELWTRTGGRFRPGVGGGTVAEFTDSAGAVVTKRLP